VVPQASIGHSRQVVTEFDFNAIPLSQPAAESALHAEAGFVLFIHAGAAFRATFGRRWNLIRQTQAATLTEYVVGRQSLIARGTLH